MTTFREITITWRESLDPIEATRILAAAFDALEPAVAVLRERIPDATMTTRDRRPIGPRPAKGAPVLAPTPLEQAIAIMPVEGASSGTILPDGAQVVVPEVAEAGPAPEAAAAPSRRHRAA